MKTAASSTVAGNHSGTVDTFMGLILGACLLGLTYFVTGYLSLLLALPPDFAIVLWAPAGFALAGLLLFGYRIWPGVWLGAFCVTLFVSDGSGISASSVLFAVVHASGATLQALVGTYRVKRFVSFPSSLVQTRDTLLLIIFGGPVACLINSINGAVALQLFGFATKAQFATNWFTWWIGDAVGVIAFTPVLILLFSPSGSITRQRKQLVTSGLLVMFVLGGFAYSGVKQQEQNHRLLEFQNQSREIVN